MSFVGYAQGQSGAASVETSDRSDTTIGDYAGWPTEALLRDLLTRAFPGRIALVSSFGAESSVLLHLVATIDRTTPVIFVDTGKLFPETLAYRDALCRQLGLTAVRTVGTAAKLVADVDPSGTLWRDEPEVCCWHRKVEQLDEALAGFAAWITGRKRFQGGLRGTLPVIEHEPNGRVKVNPLATWSVAEIREYRALHTLPDHPLEVQGYRSIGCAPCTRPAAANEDKRAGRWAGQAKTECGIHLARPVVAPVARN